MILPEAKLLTPLKCKEKHFWVHECGKTVWLPELRPDICWGAYSMLSATACSIPKNPTPAHGPSGLASRPIVANGPLMSMATSSSMTRAVQITAKLPE